MPSPCNSLFHLRNKLATEFVELTERRGIISTGAPNRITGHLHPRTKSRHLDMSKCVITANGRYDGGFRQKNKQCMLKVKIKSMDILLGRRTELHIHSYRRNNDTQSEWQSLREVSTVRCIADAMISQAVARSFYRSRNVSSNR